MRLLTRFATIGILITSCSIDLFGPEDPIVENCQPDTEYQRYPDSLRLTLGAADNVVAFRYVEVGPCAYEQRQIDGLVWTVRDSSITSVQVGDAVTVVPRRPGRTYVVLEGANLLDSLSVTVPDTFAVGSLTAIAAEGSTSCAISESDRVLCWGNAGAGQMGEPYGNRSIGTCFGAFCSPMPIPLDVEARKVFVGESAACALDAAGSASCWGHQASAPTIGGATKFASLTIGSAHTCGVSTDQKAYCWGSNHGGQRGTSSSTQELTTTPEPVEGDFRWISLDASHETTCGVTDAGNLYCWGILAADSGSIPGASTCEVPQIKSAAKVVPCSFVPLRMPLGPDVGADTLFVQVSRSCVLSSSGSVYCADPATAQYSLASGSSQFTEIWAGSAHKCGLNIDGSALCWGANSLGQLGDGSTVNRALPVAVGGLHTFTDLALGNDHSCGLSDTGEVWCWGGNAFGQSGTSILEIPTLPTKVRGQSGL